MVLMNSIQTWMIVVTCRIEELSSIFTCLRSSKGVTRVRQLAIDDSEGMQNMLIAYVGSVAHVKNMNSHDIVRVAKCSRYDINRSPVNNKLEPTQDLCTKLVRHH
jgi:hypothetical protein